MEYEIDLLMRLVSVDTTSTIRKNFEGMADLLVYEARKASLIAKRVVDDKGIPHVIIKIPKAPKKSRKIIFLTHYDVVPAGEDWDFDPFKPFIKDGKLYGRGAADSKSNIAAAIAAFKEVLEEGLPIKINPVLVIIGGEESGEGTSFYNKLEGDVCVVLDSGCYGLSVGASGVVSLIIKVFGRQAHSAYPFLGKNAIHDAAKIISFIDELAKKYEEKLVSNFRSPTYYKRIPRRINVTMIEGGVAPNVIPSECVMTVNIRTMPEENSEAIAMEVKEKLENFTLKNNITLDVKVKDVVKGWYTKDTKIIESFKKVLEDVMGKEVKIVAELGATDGVFLIDKMPVIQFGTMRDENNVHGKNEFVYLEDVELVKNFVKKVITSIDL